MLRWRRVEFSGGFLLLMAALYYFDTDGFLFWALAACAFHELGHWAAIRALGGRVALLRLTCVGAEMRLSTRYPLDRWRRVTAALAGPAVSLGLALAAARLAGWAGERGYLFAGLNLALGTFNLLPMTALDGGRALQDLLASLAGEERAAQVLGALSRTLAAVLLLGSAVLLWRGRGNVTLLITAAWLTLFTLREPIRT